MSAVLVIAGSDSSGGAGLVRDVRTLTELGSEALCALTAVTAQSDREVIAVYPLPHQLVRAQMDAALATGRVRAIKIGMLATAATVRAVAETLARHAGLPVVLDPVLAASSGGALLDADGLCALRELLLPRAQLLTPNIPEAAALLAAPVAESEAELLRQGQALLALGSHAVLLKGGHSSAAEATDLLVSPRQPLRRFAAPRIGASRRGTGCTLASAIAAGLAAHLTLTAACARAKSYVTQFLQRG
ncbi:MAG TPA: bifunctional hydroxymethylpyrimidine kinase/phosphomethylpyrimidine kinase [Steroidobacteraceae bacterium]